MLFSPSSDYEKLLGIYIYIYFYIFSFHTPSCNQDAIQGQFLSTV